MARFRVISPQLPTQESTLGTGLRNIATLGTRAAETILGGPGDIAAGLTGLINAGLRGAGVNPKVLPEAPSFLPTSQTIREKVTKPFEEKFLPQNYLTPQSPAAETAGDITQFITGVLTNPLGRAKGLSIPKVLGTSIIGELGAQGVKSLGGGPIAQTAGRIGSAAITSLFGGRKQVSQDMQNAYKNARYSIKDKSVSPSIASQLRKNNTAIFDQLSKRITDDKNFLRDSAKTIDKIAIQKSLPVSELWDVKIDLNNHLANLNPKSTSFKLTKQLLGNVNSALQNYAETNKDFGKNFRLGEELYKGLNAGTEITNFLRKNVNIDKIAKKPLTKVLLFTLSPAKIGAGFGTALGARELGKFKDLITQSPHAQKIYGDLLKSALEQNSKAVIRHIAQLDNEVGRFEKRSGIKRFRVIS